MALPSQMSQWDLVSPTWELNEVRQALFAHPEVMHLWVKFRDWTWSSQLSKSPALWAVIPWGQCLWFLFQKNKCPSFLIFKFTA